MHLYFFGKFEAWKLDVSGRKEKSEAKRGEGEGKETSSFYRPPYPPPKISSF